MGDRIPFVDYIPFVPRRSMRTVRIVPENVEEVKNARVCESVDEEDGNGLGIEPKENERIVEKTLSQETDVNLGGIDHVEEMGQVGFDLDLNIPVQDDEIQETFEISSDKDDGNEERFPFDYEGGGTVRRYTREEKGKGKVVDNRSRESFESDGSDGSDESEARVPFYDFMDGRRRYSREEKGKGKMLENWLSIDRNSNAVDWETSEVGDDDDDDEFNSLRLLSQASEMVRQNEAREMALQNEARIDLENRKRQALFDVRSRVRRRRQDSRRIIENGSDFVHGKGEDLMESSDEKNEISSIEVDKELEDTSSPFSIALKTIKERNSWLNAREKTLLIKWTPSREQGHNTLKTRVPSLLDLSIEELAKNADVIVSLEPAPDGIKHKLSRVVCDSRKMNGQFLKLLMSGSPTEVRVHNCSLVTEEEFSEILQHCDTKNLRVLQLDLCGRCLPDYTLSDILARSLSPFPALATISLRGAGRLSDTGVQALTLLAPSLQSINLGQCSLLTSASINTLANCFGSILKELYIDYCPDIDALQSLPALKKFEHLEVLSVAGIPTVSDAFVTELITARGQNMKDLMLADCVNLTDISLKIIGNSCNNLCEIDLSKLHRLTDSGIRYLANGCRSIQVLKLSGIDFSDEAIAAFLEVSGSYLKELSLNYVSKVGFNTALSLSKYSTSLLSLDLSWCRKLTDEALGIIVDSCLSLRLLKLFGCSQITEVFLNGHSNSSMRIIGLKHLPLLKHLDLPESQETPLRYQTN